MGIMAKLLGRLYDSVTSSTRAMTGFVTGMFSEKKDTRSRNGGVARSAARSLAGNSPSSWQPWSGNPYQQLLEYRNWVYTSVRFRGLKRQTAPLVASIRTTEDREKWMIERRKAYAGGPYAAKRHFVLKSHQSVELRTGQELEYAPADHPAMKLFHDPNEPQIGQDLWFMASIMEDLTGRAHIWKVRNGSGQVIELWIIPTPWVQPMPSDDRLIGYYLVTMPTGGTETIDADDMITIGEPSPFGYLAWQSPTQAHGLNIDLYNAIVVSRFNGLTNGANVGSMIKIPSTMANNPEMMARFEQSLLARTIGTINYNRPLIAEEGADLINLAPQMEVAFQESAETQRRAIFAAYDIDESVLGYAAESTYAGAVVTDRNVYKKVVKPYWERRNATLTEKLLKPDFGEDLVAFNEHKTEETPDEKRDRIDLQARYGAISVNEIRTEFDQEPYEDPMYDEPLITSNQAKMDEHKAGGEPGGYDVTPPGGKQAKKSLTDRFTSFYANGVH